MQDDLRADRLYRALAGEEPLDAVQDDEELQALYQLAAELEALAPTMAEIARAEQAFDPAFAQRLKSTLLAEHPAASRAPVAVAATDAQAKRAGGGVRVPIRRLLGILALALVAGVALLIALLHGNGQPALVGTESTAATTTSAVKQPRIYFVARPTPSPGQRGRSCSTMCRHPLRRVPGANGSAPRPMFVAPKQEGTQGARQLQATKAPATAQRAGRGAGGPGIAPTPAGGAATPSGQAFAQSMGVMTPRVAAGTRVFQYQLPRSLPAVPASAPLYTLRYAPLSEGEVQAIVASFPAMHTIGGGTVLAYGNARERLQIARDTGEVDYMLLARAVRAPTSTLTPARAILIARTWLIGHHLYPQGGASLVPTATTIGSVVQIRFAPRLPLPLAAQAPGLALTVDLDAGGQVLSAHRLWPELQRTGTAGVLSPQQAVRALSTRNAAQQAYGPDSTRHAPAVPAVQVRRVTLIYQPSGTGRGATLQPAYLLEGTLAGAPFSQIIPAIQR